MGSWNETCGLSNLPIGVGDKVVFLLLTQNPYADHVGRSGCYTGDFFFPRSIPLYGKYDDYGTVLIDDGQEAIIDLIKQGFAVDLIPQEASQYRHGPINMGEWTIYTLQDWLHEGKVRIDKNALHRESDKENAEMYAKLAAGEAAREAAEGITNPDYAETRRKGMEALAARQLVSPSPVYKLIIRRDVWDTFTSTSCKAWYGEYSLERYRKEADAVIDNLSQKLTEDDGLGGLPEGTRKEFRRLNIMMFDSDKENAFSSRFMSIGGGSGDPPYEVTNRWYAKRMVDSVMDGTMTTDALREIFYRMAELAQVEHIMAMTRRAWAPTVGMGSQSEENELALEVFVKLARVAEGAILDRIEDLKEYDKDDAKKAARDLKKLKKRLGF